MEPHILTRPVPDADSKHAYGLLPQQFGELRLPDCPGPHPVAIVIHGGFWRNKYNLAHIGHLCHALRDAGFATWSLEYRRLGDVGGGWPGTFEDIGMGADYLGMIAGRFSLDIEQVIAVGHSAGGHLAAWLAARHRFTPGEALRSAAPQRVHGVISLAGVVDLKLACNLHLGGGAAAQLMGGYPDQLPERYRSGSPIEQLPLGVPVRLVHGRNDDLVPLAVSQHYLNLAKLAGDDVSLTILDNGDHFSLIDPCSDDWATVERVVSTMSSQLARQETITSRITAN